MAREYRDAYLKQYCDTDVEAIAVSDVGDLGTFTGTWLDRLVVLRAYINVCMEHQGDVDDLFSDKYKRYSSEFDGVLAQARTAAVDDEGNLAPVFSIPLERA